MTDARAERWEEGGEAKRLVVVSNRLPIVIKKEGIDGARVEAGAGGLVRALTPVLRDRGGVWIGWLGAKDLGEEELEQLLERGGKEVGYTLQPVELTEEDIAGYYLGFSNEILWPLFHDMVARCNFDPAFWAVYEGANRKFARVIAEQTTASDYIWVQDYHLMLVARELRALGARRRLGFYLHIPFPPVDIFIKLPWRHQILAALLQFDMIGFQTLRDRRNFVQCVRTLVEGARPAGTGSIGTIDLDGRRIRVGAFPIGIDYQDFARRAAADAVTAEVRRIRERLPGRTLILGVDRLDYSKGIPHRIKAFAEALHRFPELHGNVTFLQVVVPSRTDVEEYQALKREIDQLIGMVNGRFTQMGWTPIHYIFRSLHDTELLAYYRTCEIALITPLKDGMNLVAKEYCASSIEGDGVLILSEFAGAAAQLHHGALLVNPFDLEGTARAIRRAYHMDREERRERMAKLRRTIRKQDIYRWVDAFLYAAIAKNLRDFPAVSDYVPWL